MALPSAKRHAVAIVLAASGVVASMLGAPAGAAPPAPRATAPAPELRPHCATKVHLDETRCFVTFTESIAYATNGAITDAPSDARLAAHDAALQHRLEHYDDKLGHDAEDTALLSIEYDDERMGAPSFTNSASAGCDADPLTDWAVPTLTPTWNDRISSWRGYNRCEGQHFEHEHFGGVAEQALTRDVAILINNRTSSIRWR